MHHKLTSAAIAVAAAVGSLTAILPGTAAAEAVYHVSGTDGLGVRVHDEASLGSNAPGTLFEGSQVVILCQTYGDTVTDPQTGISSNIWDDIGTDQAPAYVSDLYVDTPAVGNFSPGIPQCFTGSSGDF